MKTNILGIYWVEGLEKAFQDVYVEKLRVYFNEY